MINLDKLEKLESKTSYAEPKEEDQKDWVGNQDKLQGPTLNEIWYSLGRNGVNFTDSVYRVP